MHEVESVIACTKMGSLSVSLIITPGVQILHLGVGFPEVTARRAFADGLLQMGAEGWRSADG